MRSRLRTIAGNEFCTVQRADRAREVVYAIRRCFGEREIEDLVRIGPDNRTAKVDACRASRRRKVGGFRAAKPGENGAIGCVPVSISVRPPDDVWVAAKCGGGSASYNRELHVPVLLRRGRPQESIVIP